MECLNQAPSLAYEAPSLQVILTLSAFLIGINVLHDIIDDLLHVGLLAQLILGAVFGAPLANILPSEVQKSIQALGYLGLLLLVFEGGMTTRLDILSSPKTLILAFLTGTIGILMPIALSMILLPFAYSFTYLESFVVGVSLSSTSLGTTLAVIGTASPKKDEKEKKDPIGDTDGIRLQSIREVRLPSSSTDTPAANRAELPITQNGQKLSGIMNTRIGTILIGAALLDDIIALVLSSVVRSLGSIANGKEQLKPWPIVRPFLSSFLLISGTVVLVRFVIKPLAPFSIRLQNHSQRVCGILAKFHLIWPRLGVLLWLAIICAFVSIADEIDSTDLIGAFCAGAFMIYAYKALPDRGFERLDPNHAFDEVKMIMHRILVPFFFASIGFAIPIKELFQGGTIWRGVLFSGLMACAKVMACMPVLIISFYGDRITIWSKMFIKIVFGKKGLDQQVNQNSRIESGGHMNQRPNRIWLPALFLGCSLVARGEIGFLIINIGRQVDILSCNSNSPTALLAFDVGVWAITLNTFIGPTLIGILLRSEGCLEEIEAGKWGIVS
jgi:Kef-type K+ transport system membrane component KefB